MVSKLAPGHFPTRNRFGSWVLGFLLVFPLQALGLNLGLPYAPQLSGDGQTATWRIIDKHSARTKPWTAIGNILIPGLGGYCSGVLVAPRVVLTANHCLYAVDYRKLDGNGNPAKQLMDPKLFVFVAGVHDSSFVDLIPVEDVVTGGWVPGSQDVSKDWMVVILKRAANADIDPIAIRPYELEAVAAWKNKVVVAAYPGASFTFSRVLRFSVNCSMLKSGSADVLSHDCSSEGGSSGAPILVEEDGVWKLVGLHTSTGSGDARRKYGVSIHAFLGALNTTLAGLDAVLPMQRASRIDRPGAVAMLEHRVTADGAGPGFNEPYP